MARDLLIAAQSGSFLVLGAMFCAEGNPRLGVAQGLLAIVNFVVYS